MQCITVLQSMNVGTLQVQDLEQVKTLPSHCVHIMYCNFRLLFVQCITLHVLTEYLYKHYSNICVFFSMFALGLHMILQEATESQPLALLPSGLCSSLCSLFVEFWRGHWCQGWSLFIDVLHVSTRTMYTAPVYWHVVNSIVANHVLDIQTLRRVSIAWIESWVGADPTNKTIHSQRNHRSKWTSAMSRQTVYPSTWWQNPSVEGTCLKPLITYPLTCPSIM